MRRGSGTMGDNFKGEGVVSGIAPTREPTPRATEGEVISKSTKFQDLIIGFDEKNNLLLTFFSGRAGSIVMQEIDHQRAYYAFDASWSRRGI
jgi:hypothetical protein